MKGVDSTLTPLDSTINQNFVNARRAACCVKGCGGFEIVTLLVLSILVGLGWSGTLPMNIVILGILTAFVPLTIIFSCFLFKWGNDLDNKINHEYSEIAEIEKQRAARESAREHERSERLAEENLKSAQKKDEHMKLINACQVFSEELRAFTEQENQDRNQAINLIVEGKKIALGLLNIREVDLKSYGAFEMRQNLLATLNKLTADHSIQENEIKL